MFSGCQTQWRYAGMGGRTGLDYAGVQAVMAMQGVDDTRDTLSRVQVLERTTLLVDQCKACKAKREADTPCEKCGLEELDAR